MLDLHAFFSYFDDKWVKRKTQKTRTHTQVRLCCCVRLSSFSCWRRNLTRCFRVSDCRLKPGVASKSAGKASVKYVSFFWLGNFDSIFKWKGYCRRLFLHFRKNWSAIHFWRMSFKKNAIQKNFVGFFFNSEISSIANTVWTTNRISLLFWLLHNFESIGKSCQCGKISEIESFIWKIFLKWKAGNE